MVDRWEKRGAIPRSHGRTHKTADRLSGLAQLIENQFAFRVSDAHLPTPVCIWVCAMHWLIMVSALTLHLVDIVRITFSDSESTLLTPPSCPFAFPLGRCTPGPNILTPPPFGHAIVIDRLMVVFGNNCISNVVFSVIGYKAILLPNKARYLFWVLGPTRCLASGSRMPVDRSGQMF